MGGGWSEDCERRRGFAVAEEAAGVIDLKISLTRLRRRRGRGARARASGYPSPRTRRRRLRRYPTVDRLPSLPEAFALVNMRTSFKFG